MSGLRVGRIYRKVHTLVVRRRRAVRRWGGCMLHNKNGYCWCTHACSSDSLVGGPMSGGGRAAESAEAKR